MGFGGKKHSKKTLILMSIRQKERWLIAENRKNSLAVNPFVALQKYPNNMAREVSAFKALQGRVAKGVTTTTWSRTTRGFNAFLKCVGRCPKNMKCPTIGRKDHLKGYQPGNCGWQEKSDNTAELWTRPEYRKAQEEIKAAYWLKPGAREKQAEVGRVVSEKRWKDPKQRKAQSDLINKIKLWTKIKKSKRNKT